MQEHPAIPSGEDQKTWSGSNVSLAFALPGTWAAEGGPVLCSALLSRELGDVSLRLGLVSCSLWLLRAGSGLATDFYPLPGWQHSCL